MQNDNGISNDTNDQNRSGQIHESMVTIGISVVDANNTTSTSIPSYMNNSVNVFHNSSSTTIYNNNDNNNTNRGANTHNDTTATITPPPPPPPPSTLKYQDMEYAIQSFYTIVQPVFCTMILSALAVVYISTPQSSKETQAALESTYYVVHSDPNTDSATTQFANSLLNAFVIVLVICGITFIIVLLYKYNCIKCLIGYLMVSIGLFLGYLGAIMFTVAIERYQLFIDKVTFIMTMYNFAVVGVISIFAGTPSSTWKVVPVYMNQIYLIFVSVIAAWQLSHFDDWTAWVLLVLLALYDLFAVLTPFGPLKALVNLMQRENAPTMPGLLYEASLSSPPPATTNNATSRTLRGSHQQQQQQQTTSYLNSTRNNITTQQHSLPSQATVPTSTPVTLSGENNTEDNGDSRNSRSEEEEQFYQSSMNGYNSMINNNYSNTDSSGIEITISNSVVTPNNDVSPIPKSAIIPTSAEHGTTTSSSTCNNNLNVSNTMHTMYDVDTGEPSTYINEETIITQPLIQQPPPPQRSGMVPFAIAKLYRLRFRYDPQPSWITHPTSQTTTTTNATSETLATATGSTADGNNSIETSYTPEQLKQLVEVIFPSSGGSIVPTISLPNTELYRATQHRDEARYTIIDYRGVHKRVLFVNDDGRVFQDLREERYEEEQSDKVRNSIKLGLGDFIFYSILVSKAALYGYTTFVVCTLAVLSGLGLTLLLLAIYGHALPALPISIMLGVLFYIVTRYIIEPWIEDMYVNQIYG